MKLNKDHIKPLRITFILLTNLFYDTSVLLLNIECIQGKIEKDCHSSLTCGLLNSKKITLITYSRNYATKRRDIMAEKHLIALDLDGTLLKNDKTISHKTKHVIQKAREAGHVVMIATGRPFRSSEMYYRELQLDTPIVNFNGAFVHHPQG